MSPYKKVRSIHTAPETMMGPIKLRQAFPLQGIQQVSPFILLHHFDFTYKPFENLELGDMQPGEVREIEKEKLFELLLLDDNN